jgi:hypothetical protein
MLSSFFLSAKKCKTFNSDFGIAVDIKNEDQKSKKSFVVWFIGYFTECSGVFCVQITLSAAVLKIRINLLWISVFTHVNQRFLNRRYNNSVIEAS